jgi:hypothetical protein
MYGQSGNHFHAANKCPIQTTCDACHDQAVQLLPAVGWWAWYAETNDDGKPATLLKEPLVGWALQRNGVVVPLVHTLDEGVIAESPFDGASNYIGTFHENQPGPSLELAAERLADRARHDQARAALRKHA